MWRRQVFFQGRQGEVLWLHLIHVASYWPHDVHCLADQIALQKDLQEVCLFVVVGQTMAHIFHLPTLPQPRIRRAGLKWKKPSLLPDHPSKMSSLTNRKRIWRMFILYVIRPPQMYSNQGHRKSPSGFLKLLCRGVTCARTRGDVRLQRVRDYFSQRVNIQTSWWRSRCLTTWCTPRLYAGGVLRLVCQKLIAGSLSLRKFRLPYL